VPEWVVGLVGVVVGGLLTGGVTYFLEQRREKREARAAQLVMKSELEAAATAVEVALLDGTEWAGLSLGRRTGLCWRRP
jgi:type II secretory pathway pseudopilin PulG